MTHRARAGIALLLFIQGLVGCGRSGSSSTPLAPSPAAPLPPQQSLSGYVGDTAFRSVASVTVEVVDGPQAGMSVTSDANGRFSYAATFASPVTLRATKDGYITATTASRSNNSGGMYAYFQLEAVASPVNVAGNYTLTLIVDSACAGIPQDLRTRTYAATIVPRSNPTFPGTSFTLTAEGASLLEGYKSFWVGVAGDSVGFVVYNGDSEDAGLVEQVAPKTYLAFSGLAAASVGQSGQATISTPLDGAVEYCLAKAEMGSVYACNPIQAVDHQLCESKNHRLMLARR